MARTRLIRNATLPYHVYARSNNREWFYLDQAVIWQIFMEALSSVCEKTGMLVHAFVLMGNHFHMLATTPNSNLDYAMMLLQKRVSDQINIRANRINHVFGGPYKWTIIDNWFHYLQAYRYVYQNPMRSNLSHRGDEYRFSTFYPYADAGHGLPLCSNLFQSSGMRAIERQGERWDDWLNAICDVEEVEPVRKALYRRRFRLSVAHEKHRLPKPLIGPEELEAK